MQDYKENDDLSSNMDKNENRCIKRTDAMRVLEKVGRIEDCRQEGRSDFCGFES